ncbi:MAG: hypothetical protein AB8B55_23640 [Mariniblastus sp.]
MENDPEKFSTTDARLKRIERKLNLLFGLAVAQLIVIVFLAICLVIKQFMPSTFSLVLFSLALAGFGYFFRGQIPSWFGNGSRLIFSQLFAAQKSESIKDIK